MQPHSPFSRFPRYPRRICNFVERFTFCTICTSIVLSVASLASAQFTTLDPQQVSSHAGVNISAVVVDQSNSDLKSVGRADLYAEVGFVNYSIYGALPAFATLSGSPSNATIGNLEVGGAHRWTSGGRISVVSHVGLVFPTASSSDKKVAIAEAGSSGKIGDLFVSSLPSLWGIRVAASPRADFGAFFMQGDLGFDFLFPNHQSNEVGMRTSVGAGFTALLATATIEVANAGLLSQKHSFDQTASIGVVLNALFIRPRITYTTSLGNKFGEEYTLTAGASIGF